MSNENGDAQQGVTAASSGLQPTSDLPADWSTDTFPTSAKGVFFWASLMICGVIMLCFYVYATSEHRPNTAASTKKNTARENVDSLTDPGDKEELLAPQWTDSKP